MFTQTCIIRKNTDELIERLSDLGDRKIVYVKEWNRRRGFLVRPKVVIGLPYDSWEFNLDKYLSENKFIIDCGTNEELFLAIAALRDDSDKNQWFASNYFDVNMKPDRFVICTINDYKEFFGDCPYTKNYDDYHKATVEELIEHFKEE